MKIKILKEKDKGISFAETLAVLLVSAILASTTIITSSEIIQKAKTAATKTQLSMFQAALQSYYADCGKFPTAEQGLDSLWLKPQVYPVPENWAGPYIEKENFNDAWGNRILYFTKKSLDKPEDAPSGLPFILISYGADAKRGGDGADRDICSWKD